MKKFHVDEDEETVTLEVGKAVALVLDDLLARWTDTKGYESTLKIEHDAEWHALNLLAGTLETQLTADADSKQDYLLDTV